MVKIERKRLEKIIYNHKISKNQDFHKTRKKIFKLIVEFYSLWIQHYK